MQKLSNLSDLTPQRFTQSRPVAVQAALGAPTAGANSGFGAKVACTRLMDTALS